MNSLNDYWAKTDIATGFPCLSVTDHCIIVGTVAETLLDRLPQSVRGLLPAGSVVLVAAHDIGKLTPGFQLKAPRWPWYAELKQTLILDNLATNHAIVSQWHLQCHEAFAQSRSGQFWLISTGGHHGSYPCGSRPLKAESKPYEGGIQRFIALRNELLEILIARFGPLPTEGAKGEEERIHLLTGFTIFSDWIGSNADWFPPGIPVDSATLRSRANQCLNLLNWNPKVIENLSFGEQFNPIDPSAFRPRSIQQTLLRVADSPGLYIVEAPMGMGKTEAALTAAYQRWTTGDELGLYFALPTQLTSNKIHDRITTFLENTLSESSIQTLIHGNAWLGDKKCQILAPRLNDSASEAHENEHNDLNEALRWYSSTRKQLIARFGTGTTDQALLAVLPARFSSLRYFALAGKVVVIDEVHSFDPYMSALIDRLVRYLTKAGSTVIILSATLTAKRRAELVEAAGAVEGEAPSDYPLITKVALGASRAVHTAVINELPEKTVHFRHEHLNASNHDVFWDQIVAKVEAGANVVVIRNTVALAQETYRQLKARLSDQIPAELVGLLHSRFPQKERNENEEKWTRLLGKDDSFRPTGSLLVSTQIVEQSVDIDADLLVTDLAPTELILQRVGRLHRHRRPRSEVCAQATCHILHPVSDWRGTTKEIKETLSPHHYVYPPLSLWQAATTLNTVQSIQLPGDIRHLLETSASHMPSAGDGDALTAFATEYTQKRDAMLRTAKLRDVFDSSAIEDQEGTETRYGIKPTAQLVILPRAPVEQGGRVTWHLPDGSIESHHMGEFSFAVSKALQAYAARIPAYWVKSQLVAAPDWLRHHLDSGVLAIQTSDSTELRVCAPDEAAYTLHYRRDLGITGERKDPVPVSMESEDFWY